MVHEHLSRHFGWAARAFVLAFAVLVLPMAPGVIDRGAADAGEIETSAAAVEKTPYPQIMETVPKIGATDVDPALREITVTFDRDMGGGMSWTGGPPFDAARGQESEG